MLFICLSGYWYYTAQKNALQSNQYYRLQHIADAISRQIISSHMKGAGFHVPADYEGVQIALVAIDNEVVYGKLPSSLFPLQEQYYQNEKEAVFISKAPQDHLNVRFIVLRTQEYIEKLQSLNEQLELTVSVSIFVMIVLAWILSKLFIHPVHQKIKQIEDFVHDTAHELNTPITALSMSVSRALKKETYDAKILKNISISTKQLFDIYTALSYLSFESKKEEEHEIDIKTVLEKSVAYYQELCESKKITLNLEVESHLMNIDETKLNMLFGNLINNAIKYSHPNSKIDISFKAGIFSIQDYGIGIEKEKLSKIYELYNRETEYAGGFGIGLSIVKKIALEYDIGLEVSSEEGKGSLFTLIFK